MGRKIMGWWMLQVTELRIALKMRRFNHNLARLSRQITREALREAITCR